MDKELVVSGPLRRVVDRHASPIHPGTGTEQAVHAGDGEAGVGSKGSFASASRSERAGMVADFLERNYETSQLGSDLMNDIHWIAPDGRIFTLRGWDKGHHAQSVLDFLDEQGMKIGEAKDILGVDKETTKREIFKALGFVRVNSGLTNDLVFDLQLPISRRAKATINDILAIIPEKQSFYWSINSFADNPEYGKDRASFYRRTGIVKRHASEIHPGTGSDQSVHAGNGGGGKRKITAYHGGGKGIEQFDFGRASSSTGNPTAQWGAFFTPSEVEAARYISDFHGGEGQIYEADISLNKPYEMSFGEYDKFTELDLSRENLEEQMAELSEMARKLKDRLVSEGYDGVIIGDPGYRRYQEIVVFKPEGLLRWEPKGDITKRHYGPGAHPGTGSPQQAHAGGRAKSPSQYVLPPEKFGDVRPALGGRLARAQDWGDESRSPGLVATLDYIEREIADNDFETAYLVDLNGDILFKVSGAKSFIMFSDEEMSEAYGTTMIHNHPSDRSLSDDDILLASSSGLREIIAVGPQTRYMFRLSPEPDRREASYGKAIKWRIYEAATDVRKIFQPKVNDGTMTIERAGSLHWNEMWKNLETKYPHLFDYVSQPRER